MKQAKNISALVVDDVPLMRKLLIDSLRPLGITNVIQAPDGQQGLDILIKKAYSPAPIDIVFCDWAMPQMTGIDLLKKVRAHESLEKTPFILITSEISKDNVLEAMRTGVSGYIVKPFSPATLKEKIVKSISNIQFEEDPNTK